MYLVPDPMLSCSVTLFYVNWCLEYILGNVCDKINVHCNLHLKAYGQGTFNIADPSTIYPVGVRLIYPVNDV